MSLRQWEEIQEVLSRYGESWVDQPRAYRSGSGASCSTGPRALQLADEVSLTNGLVELMLLPLQRGKRLLQPADRWKHQTRL